MYHRLLAAVDTGDRAAIAAEHAISLAAVDDSALEFLYVVDVRPVYSRYGLASLPSEEEIAHERNRGEEFLRRFVSEAADAGVSATSTVTRGTPHRRITEHAAEIDADAVVIGRPQARTFTRIVGVSTTDRVVRNADCTVIVAREF